MKPRVYIESSVISYLTARPSPDVRLLARQQSTLLFWDALRYGHLEAFISELVVAEVSRGDAHAAAQRKAAIVNLPLLDVDAASKLFAENLITNGAVPSTEPEDALHIAVATLAGVDYLASWNFAHLVGPNAKRMLTQKISSMGHLPPLIATPEEILEEIDADRN